MAGWPLGGLVPVLVALVAILVALVAAAPARADNPIQLENAQAGDSAWTAALSDPASSPAIDGYAGATSVRPGGSIDFHVNTASADRYRIEISRLGWYGGAGGRRIACLVGTVLDSSCTEDEPGTHQPAAPAPAAGTGEIDAGWSATDTLTVPAGWTSGYYLAVFRVTAGPDTGKTGFTPFVVQAPAGDRAAILVQVPVNTWQAYNGWGGKDLYTSPQAIKVSFNRPYAHRLLFNWEYPLIRFLERGGWEVSYATDDDVDADPSILLDHRLDVSAGHDEYWTKAMRDGWEAARAAGVNLAFMGANTGFWQVRYEDARRTIVGYKYSPDPYPDPMQRTTQFRWLANPRPECELEGVQFQGTVIPGVYLNYTADAAVASDPWFAGSGLSPGSVLSGLGGYEVDAIVPGCHVPPVTPLLSYSGTPASGGAPVRMDAVRYTACSGAEVFAAGSLQFSWGLDPWRDPSFAAAGEPPEPPANPGLQQAMTRALGDLTQSHVPASGPPQVCVPQVGFSASAPWAAAGQPITFRSVVGDPYGQIADQDWSFGATSDDTGPGSTTVTRVFRDPGTVKVALEVKDSSGTTATSVKTLRVCACPAPGQRGAPPWTPGAQYGAPCQLVPIGSLRPAQHRYWFQPHTGISRYALSTYRLSATRQGPIARRPISRLAATGAVELPSGQSRAPLLADLTSSTAGRYEQQQYLLAGRGVSPIALTETLCDGTSARVLTPAFGGGRSAALRVAVAGPGRLVVTVMGQAGGQVFRRVVRPGTRTVTLAIAAKALPRGLYRIVVTAKRSALGQPVVVGAARL